MIKVKIVSGGGYGCIDQSKLPVVAMARVVERGDRTIYMVDGDFIPEVNPDAGVFAGGWFAFYPSEVVPL